MKLVVNGKPHEAAEECTVASLLTTMGAAPQRVAVLVNGAIVPRDKWREKRLVEDDQVEVFAFVGGG